MLVIRPITLEDLPALEALSGSTGFGLTSLPPDGKILAKRIRASVRGFENLAHEDTPRGETYLFVMEDTAAGRVVGTSAIVSKVGGFDPFYGYRLETSVHASDQLKVRKEIQTLHLVAQHDGPCEIGSLFLLPEYRREGNGRLLSLCRFLFMADRLEYFDPVVISELRGIVDSHGHSPFWDAVGHYFFDINFTAADYLSMVNKKFIADLMPKHPIFIPLLPYTAQAVIGKVQPDTEPAMKLLMEEGFRNAGMVDIFDAGPVVSCVVKQIRSVRESVKAVVKEAGSVGSESETQIVCNVARDFRACMGKVILLPDGGVKLDAGVAAALKLQVGDTARFVSLRSGAEMDHSAPMSI